MTISNIGTEIVNNTHPVTPAGVTGLPFLAGYTVLVVISNNKIGVKYKEID